MRPRPSALGLVFAFLLAATIAAAAHADTITTFNLQGTFGPNEPLSGTLTIDTTTGVITQANITAIVQGQTYLLNSVLAELWLVNAGQDVYRVAIQASPYTASSPLLALYIQAPPVPPGTNPNAGGPPPFVGYTGSPICSQATVCPSSYYGTYFDPPNLSLSDAVYALSGSLTPATAVTPEPSSFLLLLTGVLALLTTLRSKPLTQLMRRAGVR